VSAVLLSPRVAPAQSVRQDLCVTHGTVRAVATSGNTIHTGGDFTQVGPATGSAVPLDATTGQPLSLPKLSGTVNAVAPDGSGGWYLGGSFNYVGGAPRSNLAHIESNGTVSAWNRGANSSVNALTAGGSTLYADGSFGGMNGLPQSHLAGISSPNALITVDTSPTGLPITVDGVNYTAPQSFSWSEGTPHTLAVTSPQSGGAGTRYTFADWSDAGAMSHTVTAPAGAALYTATFSTAYQLTYTATPPGGGSVVASPASGDGYYDAGTAVQLTATANAGYLFSIWNGSGTGSYSGANDPATVTMNGPLTETVYFQSTTGNSLYYVGADGGVWNNAANWSFTNGGPGGAGVPGNGDRALITPTVNKSVVLDADYTVPGLFQLYLDGSNGATATLEQSAHALLGTLESIGIQGTAVYHQTGGSNGTTGDLHVGPDGGGNGSYLLDNGSVSVGSSEYVGEGSSVGSFTQSGGTHVVHDAMKIADTPGSTGHYTLTNGALTVDDPQGSGYLTIGYRGTGTFNQSGGSVSALHLQLAQGTSGNAHFDLSAGTLTVNGSEAIGEGGVGVFHQTGGTHTMTGNLFLTLDPGSSGTYNLDGGTLNISGNIVNNGTMTQAPGATLNLGGTILGSGIIQTNGPVTLSDQSNLNSGTLQIGGGNAGAQSLTVGLDAQDPVTHATVPGNGTLSITGGTTTVGGVLGAGNDGTLSTGTGTGYIDVSGGELSSQTIILGSATGGRGEMRVREFGQVVVGGGLSSNDLIMDGGSLAVLDQDPPAAEDSVLNRSIVAGYLRDGAMTLNAGTVTTPYLKVGVTPGKIGTLTLNGGTLTTANLLAPNGAGSVIAFSGGTLNSGRSGVQTGSALVVGNGTSAARLALTPAGGTHTFANGLSVSANATLAGAGTITGLVTSAGTLDPGDAPGGVGLLSVNGAYTQTAGGTLSIDLGTGGVGTGYDALNVTGSATLAGTLHIVISGANPPTIGQQAKLLIGHPVVGTFTTVQGAGVTLSYTDTSVVATCTTVGVQQPTEPPVLAMALGPIRPNPSHAPSSLDFALPSASVVSLVIHDASGRRVRILAAGDYPPGRHTVTWDGRSDAGDAVRPGVYMVRLTASGRSLSRKMVMR
jgi:hypothetical protein